MATSKFDKQVKAIEKSSKGKVPVNEAKAIAAKDGMKKYGKAKFEQMAQAGRKRAASKKK